MSEPDFPPCFSPEAAALLQPHLAAVALSPRQVLRVAGKRPSVTYFPIDALISFIAPITGIEAFSFGRDGSSYPELPLSEPAFWLDVEASVAGKAIAIDTRRLEQLASRFPSIAKGLLTVCRAACSEIAAVSVARPRKQAPTILANWLHRLVKTTGRREIQVGHDHLARLHGINRPTVSLALAALEEKGLLSSHRMCITVRNLAGLGKVQ